MRPGRFSGTLQAYNSDPLIITRAELQV
jgi:hypothetical protein